MKIADDGKLDKWIDANMKWLKDTFGSENLVSCVLHYLFRAETSVDKIILHIYYN